jgi:flagellar basal body rod protein FlgB
MKMQINATAAGFLTDPTLDVLRAGMDASCLRHAMLAGNIANARTPGFCRSDVDFASAVRAARAQNAAQQVAESPEIASTMGDLSAGFESIRGNGGAAGIGASGPGELPSIVADGASPLPLDPGSWNGRSFVDVPSEMAHMTENALRYDAMAQLAGRRLRLLSSVVHDGRS